MSSKVQSTGRKRAAGAGKGRAIFSLTIHPGAALEDYVLGTPVLPISFSPRSAISFSPPHVGPRAKDQQASAPESLPPPEANAEAIQFLTSLSEPGLCVCGGGQGTSLERTKERRPRPGPVSLSLDSPGTQKGLIFVDIFQRKTPGPWGGGSASSPAGCWKGQWRGGRGCLGDVDGEGVGHWRPGVRELRPKSWAFSVPTEPSP